MTLATTELLATAATLYGVGGALSVLLQARPMVARGSSCDVSLRFLATYVGGYAIWLLYGLSIQSAPIVLVHAIGLLTGAVTLTVALRLRGPRLRPTNSSATPPRSASRSRITDPHQPRPGAAIAAARVGPGNSL